MNVGTGKLAPISEAINASRMSVVLATTPASSISRSTALNSNTRPLYLRIRIPKVSKSARPKTLPSRQCSSACEKSQINLDTRPKISRWAVLLMHQVENLRRPGPSMTTAADSDSVNKIKAGTAPSRNTVWVSGHRTIRERMGTSTSRSRIRLSARVAVPTATGTRQYRFNMPTKINSPVREGRRSTTMFRTLVTRNKALKVNSVVGSLTLIRRW